MDTCKLFLYLFIMAYMKLENCLVAIIFNSINAGKLTQPTTIYNLKK
jgi:hypothetical protein